MCFGYVVLFSHILTPVLFNSWLLSVKYLYDTWNYMFMVYAANYIHCNIFVRICQYLISGRYITITVISFCFNFGNWNIIIDEDLIMSCSPGLVCSLSFELPTNLHMIWYMIWMGMGKQNIKYLEISNIYISCMKWMI